MTQSKKSPSPVVLKQDAERPIAVEVLAKAIADTATGMREAFSAGLTQDALVTLIRRGSGDAVSRSDIVLVLNNLSRIDEFLIFSKRPKR